MKCEIQWVDDDGQPTPDDNEAVGIAIYERTEQRSGKTEKRYPICAWHLPQLPDTESTSWHPGTGDCVSRWRFEPLDSGSEG